MEYLSNFKANIKYERNPSLIERKQIMMVDYDGVIKNLDERIIRLVAKSNYFKDLFKDILDYSLLKDIDPLYASINKSSSNILTDFLKVNTDAESARNIVINNNMHFFSRANLGIFGMDLQRMLKERDNFFEKIYIYYPVEDLRVKLDLENIYGEDEDRIILVFGNKKELLQDHSITSYILHDIYDINELINLNNSYKIEVLIPRIMSNTTFENNEFVPKLDIIELSKLYKMSIGLFDPYNINRIGENNK